MQQAWTRWLTRALLLAACVLVPNLARAQTGKLTGVVTDAQSGQPLDGVQVLLRGTGVGTLTDENGRYFILNVPVGNFTVLARRIGYQTLGQSSVQILIDVTRTLNFQLQPSAQVLSEIVVTEAQTPLVQPGVTGAQTSIGAEEIEALPVTNIQGVLQLQQGFLQVPQNTDIVSFNDSRRNPVTPVRVRGGRGGETLSLIDGIPINNFVFGGPAFDITNEAVEQIDFQRGGFEPQYGNALSGIINVATRTGGTSLAGAFAYQTSAAGGALGSRRDELLKFNQLEGYLSGPVPGTNDRIRFLAAGRNQSGADQVVEFDNDVYDFTNPPTRPNSPLPLDLFAGLRAFGFDSERDVFGKVSFQVTPRAWLHLSYSNYQRARLPFDFDWILTNFDPLASGGIRNLTDTLAIMGAGSVPNNSNTRTAYDVVQGSIRVDRDYFAARWDQTFGRWVLKGALGQFNQERETCSFFNGICLGNRFADINFTEQFVAQGISASHPAGGTDLLFGGERLRTTVLRGDVQSQVTDHHNIQFGLFWQRHNLNYREWRNVGVNEVIVFPQAYRSTPWDAALYFQDKVEYDFLTVKLGVRYDFGRAGGLFFANPRDPTNGTSARNVCNGEVFAAGPFSYLDPRGPGAADDTTYTGFDACAKNRTMLDSAAGLAQQDDFSESSRRRQFSPRIGVSFPLTGNSAVFFNFGRFAQNPLYNNLYQNTGIGELNTDGACSFAQTKPSTRDSTAGTGECVPLVFSNTTGNTQFIGNPNLLVEQTTSYEVGYATEFRRNYSLSVILFNKDQSGLTGVRNGGVDSTGARIFDVGTTYGTSILNYTVLLNQDYQTVRGFEVQLRRRISNFWGFNVNYQFSQATTNAAPPELEFQNQGDGDPTSIQEIRSEIDQRHAFNATLQFRGGNQPPGGPIGRFLKNSAASLTFRASSGLPYTPTLSFAGGTQVERNSGTGPGSWQMDALASKELNAGGVRYGLFMNVANVFDTKNCTQVFASTGRCDSGTVDQNRRQNGNGVNDNASSTYFNRPSYYGQRRRVNAGVRISF